MPRSEGECKERHDAYEGHCRSKPWVPTRLLTERFGSGSRRFTTNTSSQEETGVSTEEGGSEGRQHDADQFKECVCMVLRKLSKYKALKNQQKRSLQYEGEKANRGGYERLTSLVSLCDLVMLLTVDPPSLRL